MTKKTIGKFIDLPFTLISLTRIYILNIFSSFIRNFKTPKAVISLFHKC